MARELSELEVQSVGGGDAAATRKAGQNSWGEDTKESLESKVDGYLRTWGCLQGPGTCLL